MQLRAMLVVVIVAVTLSCGGGETGPTPPPPPPPPPPPAPVASVTVTLSAGTAFVGGSVQGTAVARDASGTPLAGRPIVWSVENATVASVDQAGLVTAIGPGTTPIVARSGTVSGSASLVVALAPVASITVTTPQPTITVGGSTQLAATLRASDGTVLNGRQVDWVSNNPGTAQVSASGLVTGVSQGQVLITATSEGVSSGAQVTVLPVAVASVTVTPGAAALTPGQTTQLAATARDAGQNILANEPVTWATLNPGVATVSQSGLVTAAAPGTAVITATSGGQSASATITVTNVSVASVTLNMGNQTISAGDIRVLIATSRDAQGNVLTGRQVTWTSTNLSVVDGYVYGDTAVVTGLIPGFATVTATVEGRSANVQFAVLAPPTSVCSAIAGGQVYGDDGQYLGRFTNRFDSQSILNEYGSYGSRYSSTSTNNQYGQYGSPYSALSARNPYASRPPIIIKNGAAIGYYTTNTFKTPGVSPAYAMTCNFP